MREQEYLNSYVVYFRFESKQTFVTFIFHVFLFLLSYNDNERRKLTMEPSRSDKRTASKRKSKTSRDEKSLKYKAFIGNKTEGAFDTLLSFIRQSS